MTIPSELTSRLENYFDRLWPICRSITGNGLRESFGILQELIPLHLHEVPSGTTVFDWSIPKEWNIREAWIKNAQGEIICDFRINNLHIVNYSTPVHAKLTKTELSKRMHTIPEMPNAIPYLTTYYKETWGFCMAHQAWENLPEGEYEVFIDSDLKDGHLTYGTCVLPGESDEEILFSTYLCHPSMANNELSGPLAMSFIYEQLSMLPKRHYTYRFVMAPETIGIIAFLEKYGKELQSNIHSGYVLTCCGDLGAFHYKRSKIDQHACNTVAEHVLKYSQEAHIILPFSVGGSDERQYCSPGFNMPVGSLMRTPYQRFKEYHTSLDNKNFISFEALAATIDMYLAVAKAHELNRKYRNTIPFCEPQLGKRGLYPSSVDPLFNRTQLHRLLHFLSFADGGISLLDIAEKRGESMLLYAEIIEQCTQAGLIEVQG